VKRAAGAVFAAGFFQRYAAANQFDDIAACDQVVDERLRNPAGLA
jgi:hypothetical protein